MTKRDLREIAEIIWLQNYLQAFESNVKPSVPEVKEDDVKQPVSEEKPNSDSSRRDDSPPEEIVQPTQSESESIVQPINVRVESKGTGASTGQQLPVFTETAPTLDSLAYAKHLKKLVHLRPNHSRLQLDITRTIHETARNGGRLSIETKRAVANYSRLVVIEEVSETMKVWEGMGQQLLDVARSYTQFSHSTLHQISFETSVEQFKVPSGSDTVVILISDGLSSEFLGGGVHSSLSSLPVSCRIGWLHPWDYEEWYKTNVSDITTSKPEMVRAGQPLDLFLIGPSFENWNAFTRWIQRDQVSGLAGKRVYPPLPFPAWLDEEESEDSSEEATDIIRENAERLLDTLETFAARQVTDLLAIVACLPWGGVDLDILLRLGQRFVYGTFNRTHVAQLIASGVLYKDGKRSTNETTVFCFPNQETRLVFRRNMPKNKIVPVINFLLDQVAGDQSRQLGIPTDLLLSLRAGELNLEMMAESPDDSQIEALKELADFARWPNLYPNIEQLESLRAPAQRYTLSWKERYSKVLQMAFAEAWWKDIDAAGYDHYHGIDFSNVRDDLQTMFHGGFNSSGKDEEKLLMLLLQSDFNHQTAQVLHSLIPLMSQRKVEVLQYQFEHCGPLEAGSEGMRLWQLLTCAFENASQSQESNFEYVQIPSELLKLTDLLFHFNPNSDLVEKAVYDQWREKAQKVEAWYRDGLQLNLWQIGLWHYDVLPNFIPPEWGPNGWQGWVLVDGTPLHKLPSFNLKSKKQYLHFVKCLSSIEYSKLKVIEQMVPSFHIPILPYPSILLPIEKWNQYVSVLVKGLLLGRNMYVHPELANHWSQFMGEGHWKVKDFWSRPNWGSQDWSMLIGEQHHEPEPWFLHVAGQPGSGRETTLLHAVSQSTGRRDADNWPEMLVAVGHKSIDWSSITINSELFVNKIDSIDSRSADVWVQILCQMTRDEDVLESAANLIGNDNTFTLENLSIPTGIKCVSILETELDKSFSLRYDASNLPVEYSGVSSLSPKGYQLAQPVLIEEVSQTLQMDSRPYREVERELFEMNAGWSAPEIETFIASMKNKSIFPLKMFHWRDLCQTYSRTLRTQGDALEPMRKIIELTDNDFVECHPEKTVLQHNLKEDVSKSGFDTVINDHGQPDHLFPPSTSLLKQLEISMEIFSVPPKWLTDKLNTQKLHIAVVGNTSSGASTLINALLGQDVLPRSVMPTFGIPIELHPSDKNVARVEFILNDGSSSEITPESGKDTPDVLSDIPEILSDVLRMSRSPASPLARIKVYAPLNPTMEDVVFYELPMSFAGSQTELAMCNNNSLFDLILWVHRCTGPINREEYSFVSHPNIVKRTIVVPTFVDRLAENDRDVDEIRKRLDLEQYEWVTPVSALAELNAIGASNEQQHLEDFDSGIENLKQTISDWFDTRGYQILHDTFNMSCITFASYVKTIAQLVDDNYVLPYFLSLSIDKQLENVKWLLAIFNYLDSDQQVEYLSGLVMNMQLDSLSRLDELLNFCWEWWLTYKYKINDSNVRQRFLRIFHFKSWQRFEECAELYAGKTIDVDLPQMIEVQDRHLMEHRRLLCVVGMLSNYTDHISNVRFAFHPSLIDECQNKELKNHLEILKADPEFYEEQSWGTDVRRLPMIICNIHNSQGESYVMWFHISFNSEQDIERIHSSENGVCIPRIYLLKTTEDISRFSEETLNNLCFHKSVLSLDTHGIMWQYFIFCGLGLLKIHPNIGIGKGNPFRGYPSKFMIDGLPRNHRLQNFYKKYPKFPR